MLNKSKRFLLLGLLIFYLLIIFSPNRLTYLFAHFISLVFFYKSTKDINLSFIIVLILALFSDIGFLGDLFRMEPEELNLGSGFIISPMTLLLLFLIPLSIRMKIERVNIADILVLFFSFSSLVSFYFFPYINPLLGIISLGEVISVYFVLRTNLKEGNSRFILQVLTSMVIFQTILGAGQALLGKPIGILMEYVTFTNPFGITTSEERTLFRVTGSFGHPNLFATFLLAVSPFLLLAPKRNSYLKFFTVLSIIVLFFTYSRAAWVIFVIMIILMLLTKQVSFKIPKEVPLWWYSIPVALTILFIILTPYLNARIDTIPQAFEEGGSFNIRGKLFQEGLSLVEQYPLTGVGLNRSVQEYSSSPVTDIFEIRRPSTFYRIHNTFLEIAAEIGILGLLFFILFLLYVFRHYLKSKKTYLKNAAFFGLLGLIGISMFNPFLHASQFRYFFLLAAIILA